MYQLKIMVVFCIPANVSLPCKFIKPPSSGMNDEREATGDSARFAGERAGVRVGNPWPMGWLRRLPGLAECMISSR